MLPEINDLIWFDKINEFAQYFLLTKESINNFRVREYQRQTRVHLLQSDAGELISTEPNERDTSLPVQSHAVDDWRAKLLWLPELAANRSTSESRDSAGKDKLSLRANQRNWNVYKIVNIKKSEINRSK